MKNKEWHKLKLFGLLFAALLLAGCPYEDKTYVTGEEQYAAGWLLHNIDEKTPQNLDYSEKDLAVYNYSYNFPAQQPESFSNAIFWIPPQHIKSFGLYAAPLIRLAAPLNRVHYLKGERPSFEALSGKYVTDWSFSNYISINYVEDESKAYPTEHYKSQYAFRAITPKPGEKEDIYFGKAPFTPASFLISNNAVKLNGHLIRGYSNNSHITKELLQSAKSSIPKYEVYLNGKLKEEKEMIRWLYSRGVDVFSWDYNALNYAIAEEGSYEIKIMIPTNYPVWENVAITASFNAPSDEMQPPELQHIEANPYFIPGKKYDILVDLYDESGIENVEIGVKSSDSDDEALVVLPTEISDAEKSIYAASFTPIEDYEKIYLSISATDKKGNSVKYSIKPAALLPQDISISLEAQNKKLLPGKEAVINGECKTDDGPCDTFLLRYYVNNEFLETDYTSGGEGKFALKWKIPLSYDADEANFTAAYKGTGIYLPHEKTISVPAGVLNNDIEVFNLEIGKIEVNVPVKIVARVRNPGREDAKDVLVALKVDDNTVDQKTIPVIESKKELDVEFEWLPAREGSYNIKVEAIAEGDEDSSNNILEKETAVTYTAPDIAGYIEEAGNVILNLESSIYFSIFNNGEEKAKDLKANLYAFYKPQRAFLFFSNIDETPSVPVEEPIEQPAEPEGKNEKEKKDKEPSKEPAEGTPSQPAPGGGGGSRPAIPKEKPISVASVDYNGTHYNFLASVDGFNLVVNISTETFNETINFTYNERIRKMQNGIYIFADFFSGSAMSSTIMLAIGNASLAGKALDDLEPYTPRAEAIKWTPKLKGEHFLLIFVNASSDSNFGDNYFGRYAKVLREGVNIQAELIIDYEKRFVSGNETNITARITNLGTEEAKSIHIALFEQKKEDEEGNIIPKIRKKEIGSKKLESLGAGKNEELKFIWTPSKAGGNFLQLIAEAKKDINPEDNDDTAFIDVSARGSDIAPFLAYLQQDVFANEKVALSGRIYNVGSSNSTNAFTSLYESKIKSKKYSARKLIEKRNLGIIEPDSFISAEFNWTPSSFGEFFLELESETENDENNENNADSIYVPVLSKSYDVKPMIVAYPKYIVAANKISVETVLQNFGSKNAPEFNLSLYANGVLADSAIYDGLEPQRDRFDDSLSWIPPSAGVYELKVNISLSDADNSNNEDRSEVKVFNAKDVSISFVDKNGKFTDRSLMLGEEVRRFTGKEVFTIPETALDMWIVKEDEPVTASIYSNSSISNMTISSDYINEPVMQNGLLLYDIFANNDSWNYESFKGILLNKLETLNIRYTELKAFLCRDYNFSSGKCKNWEDIASEANVGSGELLLTIDAKKAAAFAIGDKDYDNDNAPDWDDSDSDNDGIDDEKDSFTCLNGRLKSRDEFNITVNESSDTGKDIKGKNKVKISGKNKKIVEFDANFSKDKLDCREISIEKQPEVTTRGYTLIKGISLANETKTAYVDKIASFKRVCVKDAEIESIDEVTQNCNGNNEFMVICDGAKHGSYTCTDIGAQYKVDGLVHSVVAEPTSCQESWACTEWSECDDEEQERVCTDSSLCGTNFNKPSEERSCKADGGKAKSEDKGLSGSLSRSTFDLGEIEDWAAGKSRSLKIEVNDLIKFTFGNKMHTIELTSYREASITIGISWAKKSIELKKGQPANFDIDKDGKEDISVSFGQSSLNRLTLTIERIKPESAKLDVQKRAESPSQPKENATDADSKKEEKKGEKASEAKEKKGGLLKGVLYSLMSLTLIVVAGLIVYNKFAPSYRNQGLKNKEEPGSNKQSDYYKLQAYITTQLQRGATYEQISQSLQDVGWKKELIDFVIGEIKGKK